MEPNQVGVVLQMEQGDAGDDNTQKLSKVWTSTRIGPATARRAENPCRSKSPVD